MRKERDLVSLSGVENPPERGEVLNREDRGTKPGEPSALVILTNCDLSAGGASVMDFKSSSEIRSISSKADPEYKTASFTKMLTALSMKETNRCMWM